MARKSVDGRLEAPGSLDLTRDSKSGQDTLKTALSDPHYRVVAKAAELTVERLFYDLKTALRYVFVLSEVRFRSHRKCDPGYFDRIDRIIDLVGAGLLLNDVSTSGPAPAPRFTVLASGSAL